MAGEHGKAVLETLAEGGADGWQQAAEEVRDQNAADDVTGSSLEGRKTGPAGLAGGLHGVLGLWYPDVAADVGLFDLYEVAVLFAESAVAEKGGEAEVEQVGGGAGLGGPRVGGAGTAHAPVKVGQLVGEDALEVGIFLVRADDVRGGGEGIWRARERRGRLLF